MIWENKNSVGTVQVWEKEDRRELRFGNHIMQSVFSTVKPDYLVLPYTRFMLLGLLFCTEPKTVLHPGLGEAVSRDGCTKSFHIFSKLSLNRIPQ